MFVELSQLYPIDYKNETNESAAIPQSTAENVSDRVVSNKRPIVKYDIPLPGLGLTSSTQFMCRVEVVSYGSAGLDFSENAWSLLVDANDFAVSSAVVTSYVWSTSLYSRVAVMLVAGVCLAR